MNALCIALVLVVGCQRQPPPAAPDDEPQAALRPSLLACLGMEYEKLLACLLAQGRPQAGKATTDSLIRKADVEALLRAGALIRVTFHAESLYPTRIARADGAESLTLRPVFWNKGISYGGNTLAWAAHAIWESDPSAWFGEPLPLTTFSALEGCREPLGESGGFGGTAYQETLLECPFFLGGVFYGWMTPLIADWDRWTLQNDFHRARVYHPIEDALLFWDEAEQIGLILPLAYGSRYNLLEGAFLGRPAQGIRYGRYTTPIPQHQYSLAKDQERTVVLADSLVERWRAQARWQEW